MNTEDKLKTLDELLDAYENAAFECGWYSADDKYQTYGRSQICRQARAAVKARIEELEMKAQHTTNLSEAG